MATLSSDAVSRALVVLTNSFERDGCPIQAIHCLQALLDRQLPPDVEAKARLHLGRLLLEHTLNFKEALRLLLRAQILARTLMGNHSMKYEIQDQLATCYNNLGDDAMELQAYTAITRPPRAARTSSEWRAVCGWVCRLTQRAAAMHARSNRADEAVAAAREGLAFAEAHGLTLQKLVFLVLLLQLALAQWDHATADSLLAALRQALAADAAAETGATSTNGLEVSMRPFIFLHLKLLEVLYLLRLGKMKEIIRVDRQQPQEPASESDSPDVPPPPLLKQLDTLLAQVHQQQLAPTAPADKTVDAAEGRNHLPNSLPGLPFLEPLVCLVGAVALRACASRPQLVDSYLERGLASTDQLLTAVGVLPEGAESGGLGLPRQTLEATRGVLQLRSLLIQCRAQIALRKAKLLSAREDVLRCQHLQERFPDMLAPLLPGVRLLTGQYCVATGEAAAVAHFQYARQHAPSRPAAALAAVLEAQVHLSRPCQLKQQHQPQSESDVSTGDVTRALAALGPFYAVQDGTAAAGAGRPGTMGPCNGVGGGSGGPLGRQAPLGYLEESACLLASASCLAAQGETIAAKQMLSSALKLAFKRMGHTQLTCTILNQMAQLLVSPASPGAQLQGDLHSAHEIAKNSVGLSAASGDLWAEEQGKCVLAAVATARGDAARGAAEKASAMRRQQRIAVATAEALADAGRHGYAAGWGLRTERV